MRLRVAVAGLVIAWCIAPAMAADEGWLIERLRIRLDIRADGTLVANEAVDVDFKGLSRHGIFRDIRYRFLAGTNIREYPIDLTSVTSADGRPYKVQTSTSGALRRFKIGDPDRTISGKATYRIAYRVGQALNGFPDHDELYWNATGEWPVSITDASVVVSAPDGAINRVDCFQGHEGSTERCDARFTPGEATFTATRSLASGEQMTIVTGLRKGVVADPHPRLIARPPAPPAPPPFFNTTPLFLTLFGLMCVAIFGGLWILWWRVGRDRRYVALHHSAQGTTQDTQTERVPLFGARPIAVEFQPPDRLRPGQVGLIIDETADTLDITATIVDLAVRGYVKITELPKEGWFGHKDWRLDRLREPDAALLEYERIVLNGLFPSAASRTLSELKNHFHKDLALAKTALYQDAVDRKWFPLNPNSVRVWCAFLGILVAAAGGFLTMFLGSSWGAGLVGLPVAVGGLVLTFGSGAMPRRTAAGHDILYRTLGFARYMKTAETQQQAFAERANIFTEYLPYAIAFRCVDGWARAFKDIDLQAATAGWYVGAAGFNVGNFSSSLGSFSTSVSASIASTPGGSGASGFGGGGSSGGGGGGGGGGSW